MRYKFDCEAIHDNLSRHMLHRFRRLLNFGLTHFHQLLLSLYLQFGHQLRRQVLQYIELVDLLNLCKLTDPTYFHLYLSIFSCFL